MKITTLIYTATIASSFAFTAHAEMLKSDFSGKLTSMYAIRGDGSRDNVMDSACKDSFTHFMGKEISGKYEIDTAKEMGGGQLTLDGETMELAPFKMGDAYGLAAVGVTDKLSGAYVTEIHVTPSTTPGDSRAEVLLKQEGEEYNCVAATHGPQG